MSRTDLVVVYSPVGGGHKAAAFALADAARARGARVALVNAFDHAPRAFGDVYVGTHLAGQAAAPDLYGRIYFGMNKRGGLDPLRLRFDAMLFAPLAAHVRSLAPRAVIGTHHLPLVVLGRERRKGRLDCPLVGVVTDYIAHAAWAERDVDAFAVPYGRATEDMIGHGIDRTRLIATGIPVKESFERIGRAPSVAPPRGKVRVLVTSGGFGVGPLAQIVRSFADVPNAELTVICGNAEALAKRITRVAREANVTANVLGFEKNMAARIADAHVVVGKGGGLTVTETMTAGRPMIVVGAIGGNEAVNESLVVDAGAGLSAAPDEVGLTVARLRAEGRLGAMGEAARRLVPRGAADRIVDLALGRSVLRHAA